jgi:hypothetical protein
MSALTLAAEIAADLRNRERRFALGYTDHDLTRPQIADYYRRQAARWRRKASEWRADLRRFPGQIESAACDNKARECDRRAKEYEAKESEK